MKTKRIALSCGIIALVAGLSASKAAGTGSAEIPEAVRTLFVKKCAVCHKGKTPPRGLSWEAGNIAAAIDAPSREVPSLKIIDPVAPENSYLLKKVEGRQGIAGKSMPPGKPLEEAEIATLKAWIEGLKKPPRL